jgi:hypothetical protein
MSVFGFWTKIMQTQARERERVRERIGKVAERE